MPDETEGFEPETTASSVAEARPPWPPWLENLTSRDRVEAIVRAVARCAATVHPADHADAPGSLPHLSATMAVRFLVKLLAPAAADLADGAESGQGAANGTGPVPVDAGTVSVDLRAAGGEALRGLAARWRSGAAATWDGGCPDSEDLASRLRRECASTLTACAGDLEAALRDLPPAPLPYGAAGPADPCGCGPGEPCEEHADRSEGDWLGDLAARCLAAVDAEYEFAPDADPLSKARLVFARSAGLVVAEKDQEISRLRHLLAEHADAAEEADEVSPEPSQPAGDYGRVELPGYRNDTGWWTAEERFGAKAAVCRDGAGNELGSYFPGPNSRFVRLPPPPPPPLALPSGAGFGQVVTQSPGDPWASRDDDADDPRPF